MIIKNEIRQIEVKEQFTEVNVTPGRLTLGVSPEDNTMSLFYTTEKGRTYWLCNHFKRIGNINRYAKSYGVEFIIKKEETERRRKWYEKYINCDLNGYILTDIFYFEDNGKITGTGYEVKNTETGETMIMDLATFRKEVISGCDLPK